MVLAAEAGRSHSGLHRALLSAQSLDHDEHFALGAASSNLTEAWLVEKGHAEATLATDKLEEAVLSQVGLGGGREKTQGAHDTMLC